MGAKPTRLGLIGAGPWGQSFLRTIASMPGVELARLASRNPEAARLAPRAVVSPDWREVAEASDLDGVIVATPPALHAAMTRAALESGLPVLVEKPLTMDLAQAQDLLELALARGVFVLVDHIHLFHPGYEALKTAARSLGTIRSISSVGGNWGPFRRDVSALWDYGPHDAAFFLDLAGREPGAVSAAVQEARPASQGGGENVRISMEFPEGIKAEALVGNLMKEKKRRLEVRFKRHLLALDDIKPATLRLHPLREDGNPGPGEDLPFSPEPPLTRAVEAFVHAIRQGSKDLSSLELGVKVVSILARCAAMAGSVAP